MQTTIYIDDMTKFNEAQREAIVARYLRGEETVSAIARTLGVWRGTIANVLVKHGVEMRPHLHKLTPAEEAEVINRFTNGETGRELAEVFGVDPKTITSFVRDKGGPLRRPGKVRKYNSKQEWREAPEVRLRNLLLNARSSAPVRKLVFENELLDVFAKHQPTHCACCGCELDYKIYPRGQSELRAPSFDRVDNTIGYTVKNVRVVCFHCNRVKQNSSLQDLENLARYVRTHLEGLK